MSTTRNFASNSSVGFACLFLPSFLHCGRQGVLPQAIRGACAGGGGGGSGGGRVGGVSCSVVVCGGVYCECGRRCRACCARLAGMRYISTPELIEPVL